MSDDNKTWQAIEPKDLEDKIMNPNIAKSESEWWANRRITGLETEVELLKGELALKTITVDGVRMDEHIIRLNTQKAKSWDWGMRNINQFMRTIADATNKPFSKMESIEMIATSIWEKVRLEERAALKAAQEVKG
jgi:hypothetical protein